MPGREIITLSVGQAGNQIAWRFWDTIVREHAELGQPGVYDDGMSTFFAHTRDDGGGAGPPGKRVPRSAASFVPVSARDIFGSVPLGSLKARAILVDMEEGVVNQVLRSPIGDLFDKSQLITDVSGAGNNWAHGYCLYGSEYRESIMDKVRRALEACESPQSFFMVNSLGGGTGSGLGSYILQQCEEAYPELYRFVTAVFPSEDDDVVTSPYNFTLAFDKLAHHADCVLPLENQALIDVVSAVEGGLRKLGRAADAGGGRGAAALSGATSAVRASALTYIAPPPLQASKLQFAPAKPSGGLRLGVFAARRHAEPGQTQDSSGGGREPSRSRLRDRSGADGDVDFAAAPSSRMAAAPHLSTSASEAKNAGAARAGLTAGTAALSAVGTGAAAATAVSTGAAARPRTGAAPTLRSQLTGGILPGMHLPLSGASRRRRGVSSSGVQRGPVVERYEVEDDAENVAADGVPDEIVCDRRTEAPMPPAAAALSSSIAAADAAIARALSLARDPANAVAEPAARAPARAVGSAVQPGTRTSRLGVVSTTASGRPLPGGSSRAAGAGPSAAGSTGRGGVARPPALRALDASGRSTATAGAAGAKPPVGARPSVGAARLGAAAGAGATPKKGTVPVSRGAGSASKPGASGERGAHAGATAGGYGAAAKADAPGSSFAARLAAAVGRPAGSSGAASSGAASSGAEGEGTARRSTVHTSEAALAPRQRAASDRHRVGYGAGGDDDEEDTVETDDRAERGSTGDRSGIAYDEDADAVSSDGDDGSGGVVKSARKGTAFDAMNNLAAHLVRTAPAREQELTVKLAPSRRRCRTCIAPGVGAGNAATFLPSIHSVRQLA